MSIHAARRIPSVFFPPLGLSSATNAGWKVQICIDMKCFEDVCLRSLQTWQYSKSDAKAKNEQNSFDLVVHLNEHSILRNIDDGKVEMFWWKKQSR